MLYVTFQGPQSWSNLSKTKQKISGREAGFEPRQPDFRGNVLTITLYHLPAVCSCVQEIKQFIQTWKKKLGCLRSIISGSVTFRSRDQLSWTPQNSNRTPSGVIWWWPATCETQWFFQRSGNLKVRPVWASTGLPIMSSAFLYATSQFFWGFALSKIPHTQQMISNDSFFLS